MGSVKNRRQKAVSSKQKAAKRGGSPRVSKGVHLRSDLGKKVWAVITHESGVTGNLTHARAVKLAAETGGYVTTNEAILRCD
jgi:hypothetical protein